MASPITNGAQARRHIEAYERYAQRVPAGSTGLAFHLTLDPNDLVLLQQQAVLRMYGESADLDSDVFGGCAPRDMRAAVDPDDEFFGDTDPSTPKEDDEEDREQSEKTRLARLQEALSEAVLKKQLQVLFGPRSILDSLEMMRKIRMPGAPYSLLTAGSDYVESWKAAIIWCGGWHPRGSRNPNLPADRALKEVFLDNVRPQMLQAELRNMFCPTLNAMRTEFKKLYDKNYLILRAAAAVNGVTDSGQGDYSRDNTYRKMSISKENEIGRTLTQRPTSGPTDGRLETDVHSSNV